MPILDHAKSVPHRTRSTGIVLAQTGTPDDPTPSGLRSYLAEFLADPRVIKLPRWIWLPILHAVILRFRPQKVARRYQKIWTRGGSPLLVTSREIANLLQISLRETSPDVHVEVGMRYGSPSLTEALRKLRDMGADQLIVLPLFPQYSGATIGTIFDAVFSEMRAWPWTPELHLVSGYHRHPGYLRALAAHIRDSWDRNGRPKRVLFSYHGIPMSYADAGDPYLQNCIETTEAVAALIKESGVVFETVFQSRFGPLEWSGPSTEEVLRRCCSQADEHLQVICPGFSVDCLETLHEINIEARQLFVESGGQGFEYIPALNTSEDHIALLADLVRPYLLNTYRDPRNDGSG